MSEVDISAERIVHWSDWLTDHETKDATNDEIEELRDVLMEQLRQIQQKDARIRELERECVGVRRAAPPLGWLWRRELYGRTLTFGIGQDAREDGVKVKPFETRGDACADMRKYGGLSRRLVRVSAKAKA